ncbi:MAG TPA: preprotein translocase subunit SecA [Gammaproteobacteria bacterium]|nr:preprotein translocase subunit SecA [Gammaproteobacteria bacterium]
MLGKAVRKVIGSRNERMLRRMQKAVVRINALERVIAALSDDALRAKTAEFRERLRRGETLEALLPEAFAVVREAGRRVLGMRHFDVQLIGGMVLHQGKIAEMRTGEGKTLVATLAAYLNALPGHGVHVVTVNDYLAKRDAEWMGRVYSFLGMHTGVILSTLPPAERQAAYAADITYGTNNEFGFDYLRDNMVFSRAGRVQRGLTFAIVDEVDSILIDEARTPLIISGPTEDRTDLYQRVNNLIPGLKRQEKEEGQDGDYWVDEKARQVHLTERGHEHIEKLLASEGMLGGSESLYSAANISLMHHVNAALRAHTLFRRDVDYVVKDDVIVIVDEFTGRTMPGRRWSEGLHQAVEAKEGVSIQNENQTLASITFQNYFRLYKKLSGMTGTADTEAYEFQQIYGLEVVVIPTHREMIREDLGDVVYLTQKEKFKAIIADIKNCVRRGQPALVGTTSIETSEFLSGLLKREGIQHQVLNAKFHEAEAQIVAQAGRPGTVTVATNMAGRGTDIVLGGNPEPEINAIRADDGPSEEDKKQRIAAVRTDWQRLHDEVVAAGGLHIIGTERHESRRIDNQLRGRSGRQGDPGSSRFYLSLEDSLMRIFASDRVAAIMQKLGMQEGEAIEHPWVTRAIENAQRKVEARNFDIRKQLLEFDDVANDQRKIIYEQRNDLMDAEDIGATIIDIRRDVVDGIIHQFIPPQSFEESWNVPGLAEALSQELGLKLPIAEWLRQDGNLHEQTLHDRILAAADSAYEEKEKAIGATGMRQVEKEVMLRVLDQHWKEHLAAMDHLRQGIHLRGYAQRNPKQEYKREAFEMFQQLLENIKRDTVGLLSRIQVRSEAEIHAMEEQRRRVAPVQYTHAQAESPLAAPEASAEDAVAAAGVQPPAAPAVAAPFVRDGRKVGRNEPCPCGSGKKYKQCHGRLS